MAAARRRFGRNTPTMAVIVRRLVFFVVTLWAALTINFFLPRLMPGGPVLAMMGRFRGHVTPEAIRSLEIAFGVNVQGSLLVQYVQYLGNVAQGRFGLSVTFFPVPVGQIMMQALP